MDDYTFIFDDDKVSAVQGGQIVASAPSLERLEIRLAETKIIPSSEVENESEETPEEEKVDAKKSTHIITPNGLRGKILGHVNDIWGPTVTVRFENGQIASLPVDEDTFRYAHDEPETTFVETLQKRLASRPEAFDVDTLKDRSAELIRIKREAAAKLSEGVTHQELGELNNLITEADIEGAEVKDAIAHLEDEARDPYQPPAYHAVEQESMGGQTGSGWLEDVHAEMVDEVNATDFDQLMSEGPETFVAELDDVAVGDAGTTRAMASYFIQGKIAAANPEGIDAFQTQWLTRVEDCRRQEQQNRQATVKKEASASEDDHLPDDVLFG